MGNKKEQIDFIVDKKFVDSLSEPWDSVDDDIMKGERFLLFYPLYHLYLLYGIISQIVDKDECPVEIELKKMRLGSSAKYNLLMDFKKEIPIYRFVHDIMLNKIDAIKTKIDNGITNTSFNLDNTSLFQYAGKGLSVYGFNYLSLAASLGRKEIFKYFLKKGADPDGFVFYDTVKPAPIPLSINECLIMNEIFQWYKLGKKQKLKEAQVNSLIDAIILASRIAPAIVSDVHLLDNGISVYLYWTKLKEIVEDVELLKRLIPLNPHAMKEIFGF